MRSMVELNTEILDSTLWRDTEAVIIYLSALFMAELREVVLESPQLESWSMEPTGYIAPAGWYGFVPASDLQIIRAAHLQLEAGRNALDRLGSPVPHSQPPDFGGRHIIRVYGGYLILTYDTFVKRDAHRSKDCGGKGAKRRGHPRSVSSRERRKEG